jgi:16S rRNA (cytidine1402-2'-O)-methyltransferase
MLNDKNKGKIFLIPTVIASATENNVITRQVKEVIQNTNYYLCENIRTSRRFISELRLGIDIEKLNFEELDKDTEEPSIKTLLKPVLEGSDIGIMSEAGCPGIADPGSLAVKIAHSLNIQVVPLTGPSSIFLALMASGFNGQSFIFHGYVPIEEKERINFIKKLEKSAFQKQTQIFMDTPYRNDKLFDSLINHLDPRTYLCVAKNITAADEEIYSRTVKDWKQINKPSLHKVPVIFLIYSY